MTNPQTIPPVPLKPAKAPRKRQYHSGSIARAGKRWRIRWRAGGRQLSETHSSQDLARRALAGKLGDLARGKANVPLERKRTTLAELAKTWFTQRKAAGGHRGVDGELGNWTNHVEPEIGHLLPDEVTPSVLRRLIEKKRTSGRLRERGKKDGRKQAGPKGLSSSTVRLLIRLVSTMFTDLVEDGHATVNPAKSLPKKVRRLIKPAHDPRTTPFVERLEDVRRIFLTLAEPVSVAYAIGSNAGLRTGEVRALAWPHIDLERARIHVRASADGPLKDDESRIVPIQAALLPVLRAWKLKTGGAGLVIPPLRPNSKQSHIDEHTLGDQLRTALTALELPPLTWYQATRHTFASQWVLAGGSLVKLQLVMGHSTFAVTERYAHLRHDLFEDKDQQLIGADLSMPEGAVATLKIESKLSQGRIAKKRLKSSNVA